MKKVHRPYTYHTSDESQAPGYLARRFASIRARLKKQALAMQHSGQKVRQLRRAPT